MPSSDQDAAGQDAAGDAEAAEELARFPQRLRQLINDELAAGNSIARIGHSFPAPPIGAWVMLTRPVTHPAKDQIEGLSWRSRYSSTCSGEFTDGQRVFFVLEPPTTTEEESWAQAATSQQMVEPRKPASIPSPSEPRAAEQYPRSPGKAPARSLNWGEVAKSATRVDEVNGTTWTVQLSDERTPRELHHWLEQTRRVIFTPSVEEGVLTLRGTAFNLPIRIDGELRFDTCTEDLNYYTLRIVARWPAPASPADDRYVRSARGAFDAWTMTLQAGVPGHPFDPSDSIYQRRAREVTRDDQTLDSVESIREKILKALDAGAHAGRGNKEGDTRFECASGRYRRIDTGDYPDTVNFADGAELLDALYRFLEDDIINAAGPETVSDVSMWRLIWRQLNP